MYEYYSENRPLGFWITPHVKGKFRINNRNLFTEEKQSDEFIERYTLKRITKITDSKGFIIIDKFYSSYNIDKKKLYDKGFSDKDVFISINNIGIIKTAKEIKGMI